MHLQNMPLILYNIYLYLFVNGWFELICFITIVNTNFEYCYKDNDFLGPQHFLLCLASGFDLIQTESIKDIVRFA